MAAVVYHSVIYSFVGDINHQIMTNFEIVIFNTQVKTLSHTFRLDQSTKHTHTNLDTSAKTYPTTQGNNYISHQIANRPAD